jgi:twitching motility protein PilU
VHRLKELMAKSNESGMQTFDQARYQLYSEGSITFEDALAHSDSANDLRLMIKLGADAQGADKLSSSVDRLSIQDD